jgi:hypothetical protein
MKIAAFVTVRAGPALSQAATADSFSSPAHREGNWETNLSVVFQNSSNIDGFQPSIGWKF